VIQKRRREYKEMDIQGMSSCHIRQNGSYLPGDYQTSCLFREVVFDSKASGLQATAANSDTRRLDFGVIQRLATHE
jgi:hypothetical protein